MLFNSYIFAVFLSIVLVAHWAWPRRAWTGEKVFLTAASYVFYGWWDWRFLGLLAFSSLNCWLSVRMIDACRRAGPHRAARAATWLVYCVTSDLVILGFFKYFNFFIDSAVMLLLHAGLDASRVTLSILLPVGISFYTFQTLSLAADAYRGHLKETPSLLDVALFAAFFPQLVAGPIVRAPGFFSQVREKPRFRRVLFLNGWWLIWLGLFKKVVLADNLAPVVEAAFTTGLGDLDAWSAWRAMLAFSLQIYCDFSGYSDVAIGTAGLMGIHFDRNFRAPYLAVSISDFWRRWHISLSQWLRDYLYIPLGGSRHGEGRRRLNLAVTMLLGGLWHGASWNFVAWGGLHGFLLGIEHKVFGRRLHARAPNLLVDALRTLAVFAVVTAIWVPFRSPDLATTVAYWTRMVVGGLGSSPGRFGAESPYFLMGFAMLAAPWLQERGLARALPGWVKAIGAALMVYALANWHGASHAFIYFQF